MRIDGAARTFDPPLWALTAGELATGYAARRFSPVDAWRAVVARLDAINPLVNAVIAVDRAGAEDAAACSARRWRDAAPLSPLDGVPVSVKDNLFLRGLPATWGSRLYEHFVPDHDEPAVARLRRAGCVLFGKTNVPEFTVHGSTDNRLFGVTRNPHALDRTPGGSTGGGGAAVAAGIGPLAIGTDGGGSLRRPAAHCGLFALKPSVGQVARYDGFAPIMADFEVVGAVARCAADLREVHAILSGYDPRDPRSLAAEASLPPFATALRVGFLPRLGDAPVDPQIAAETRQLAQAFEASGLRVTTVAAPYDADLVARAWSTIAATGLAWHLGKFADWRDAVTPATLAMAEAGGANSAADLLDAMAIAARVREEAGALFETFDLVLCPATAALAWPAEAAFPPTIDASPVGPRGHAVFTGWMNVAGLPAVTVPVAMTDTAGGIGAQLVAGHGRDAELLTFLRASPVLARLSPARLAALG